MDKKNKRRKKHSRSKDDVVKKLKEVTHYRSSPDVSASQLRTKWKRMRPEKKKRFVAIIFAVLLLIVLATVVISLVLRANNDDISYKETDSIYRIKYHGDYYDYNFSIVSLLMIGVDTRGEMKAEKHYGDKGRADNINLVVLDRRKESIKVIPISRDTMTKVMRYSENGNESGSYTTHLGYAFSYGDGSKVSSKNVCNSVSYLLYSIPVRYYVTTNLDSIKYVNSLVGGVKAKVPNNDLKFRYPEMVKGSTVKLNKHNVESFVRYRDTGKDFSNNGRMERQKEFTKGFITQVQDMGKEEFLDKWDEINSKDSNILLNINEGAFLKIAAKMRNYDYDSDSDNLKIKGKDKVVDGHDAFYPDEKALQELVVKTFYIKE